MKLLLRFIVATAASWSQCVWRVSDGCQESIPVNVTPDRAGSEAFLSQELDHLLGSVFIHDAQTAIRVVHI